MCNKNENFAEIGRKMLENGSIRVHNIQLKKVFLLSLERRFYYKNWPGLIQGVTFIENIKNVDLNGANNRYEIWGYLRRDGVYFDTFMLLSQSQAAALQAAFDDESSPITVQLPAYTPEELRDLEGAYIASGKKFAEAYGEDMTIQRILSHPHLVDIK